MPEPPSCTARPDPGNEGVVDAINLAVREAVADPAVSEKLVGQGAVPQASSPRELQALIDSDLARYGRIIREKNLKAE